MVRPGAEGEIPRLELEAVEEAQQLTELWWYVSRSTGLVATALAVGSLVFGFLFSARQTGKRLRPAWWLDLHNWLGGLALAFTAIHMLAVIFADLGYGLVDVLVPGTSTDSTLAVTLGVLGFYGIAIASVTAWRRVRSRMSRAVWHTLHLVSIPAVAFGGLHAYLMGTDAGSRAFVLFIVLAAVAGSYAAALRITGLAAERSRSSEQILNSGSGRSDRDGVR